MVTTKQVNTSDEESFLIRVALLCTAQSFCQRSEKRIDRPYFRQYLMSIKA